jgi:hypothetical protein
LDETNSDLILPGFKENEVIYDTEKRLLKTQDATGPNVFLKNFSNYEVDFKKYYGHKEKDGYYLGWYSPGIQGYKWPKVDMHLNYQANNQLTPLVTLISSSYTLDETVTDYEDLSNDKYSGFKAIAEDKNISYLSARVPEEMSVGDIAVTARTLATINDADKINGIVIDCHSFSFKGQKMDIDPASFEFEISDGRFTVIQPIEMPSTFKWQDFMDGSKPVYHLIEEN